MPGARSHPAARGVETKVARMVATAAVRPQRAEPSPVRTARFSLVHVGTLPRDVRESRHRLLIAVLALHVPGLLLLAVGHSGHVKLAGLLALPLLAAVLAARFLRPPGMRSLAVVLGLAWSSYAVIHLAGGSPEAHLQPLFVMALVALYQDPALLVVGLVAELLVLAVPAAVDPSLVFAVGVALRKPWTWTLVHALALLGVAAASALSWRRDVPVPVFAEPALTTPAMVALPQPPPDPEVAAHLARARQAELVLAQRQTSYALMTNLARRNQSLIGRQLATLDELERDERDPDVLSGLFALDHLATRMRRNAENLLVLAGAPASSRGFAQPVPVEELLRGAAAEVEQYARVDVSVGVASAVAGHVVSDVAHLLAELLDNALACSPPDTQVTVGAAADAAGGLRLWVADEGIGMTTARLAEHNAALADPEDELEVGATLGFPVVKRLAARHRIVVTLGVRDGGRGGLVAYVDVPASVVVALGPAVVSPTASPRAPSAPPPAAALPGRRAARRVPAAGSRGRRNELALDAKHEAAENPWFSPAPLPDDTGEDGAEWGLDDAWSTGGVPLVADPPGPAASPAAAQPPPGTGLPRRDRPAPEFGTALPAPTTDTAHTAHTAHTDGAPGLPASGAAVPLAVRVPVQAGAMDASALPGVPHADHTPALSAAVSAWSDIEPEIHPETVPGTRPRSQLASVSAPTPPGQTVVPAPGPQLARRVPQQALREAGGVSTPQTFEPGPLASATVLPAEVADPARARDLLSSYRAGLSRAKTAAPADPTNGETA
jgi:signal transduction histidine kinase